MTTFFTLNAVPNVQIKVLVNGKPAVMVDGFLGVLTHNTKIQIILQVAENIEHSCYTLNQNKERVAKAVEAGEGVYTYTKKLTVTAYEANGVRSTQISAWPGNWVGIDIDGQSYSVGIIVQNGRYFFIINRRDPQIEVNELIPEGMVLRMDPLSGIATINTGSELFQAKLHWSQMRVNRRFGFRILEEGDIINLTNYDEILTDGSTSFRSELRLSNVCHIHLLEEREDAMNAAGNNVAERAK